MATYEEAYKASLEYYSGDELPAKTFVDKYALRDAEGDFKETTPTQMQERTSKELHRIESNYPNPRSYEEIFEAQKDFKYFSLQGSGMFGVGNPYSTVSLSNCYVIDSPSDDLSSIVEQGKVMANIFARRGGVGLDVSTLRPDGMSVSNAAKTTSGAWSFADFYSYVCRMVGQNSRRGALMVTMDVNHPDIFKFAKMKRDKTKVTGANVSIKLSDEFMCAVRDNTDFTLKWPVDSENPKVKETIRARDLWDVVIESAHGYAEPGLLFWDTMLDNLPAECYKANGYKHLSTNPCLSGDTLIAVADGRNAVSIKQLAEEGKDVPVYSVNKETGIISIKKGRNPRITGYEKELVRVTLDDGTFYDTTPDHKFLLRDGTPIEARKLTKGDSLSRFTKRREKISKSNNSLYQRVDTDTRNSKKDRIFEHKLIAEFNFPELWEETYDKNKVSGWIEGGLVVHHKDYDSLNNSPDNLEIMTFKAHCKYHAQHDTQGEKNGKYSGFTNEDLKQHAIELTKSLGRKYSTKEWEKYATSKGLPKGFSKFRTRELGDTAKLALWAAAKVGVKYIDEDPRVVKTLANMLEQGDEARIKGGFVCVEKTCESCKKIFEVDHLHRESSYCSSRCISDYINKDETIRRKRNESRYRFIEAEKSKKAEAQAKVYSSLKFKLKRVPLMKEWETGCKEEGIPFRVGKHSYYNTYKEVKAAGENYNHKVVSVEKLEGLHTVYNITVDDNHTISIVTEVEGAHGKNLSGINTLQCGELILPAGDSCRLLAMNLTGFVNNAFEEDASFNLKLFKEKVRLAQRMMDNLVDLEIECVKKIIKKVDTKPAKDLWKKINEMGINGRRTGLGYTGLADALAQLSIRYDSDEALEMVEEIDRTLCLSAYEETITMAEERGAFPIFDWELEKNNTFIKRLPAKLRKRAAEVGRRNISLLTNAPTGSLSIVAGNISSGIEPVFMNSYTRRKKINPSDENAKVDFIDDMGDRWQEFPVFHKNVERWIRKNVPDWDGTSFVELPDFFVTSAEIDWKKRVAVQSIITKYRDHSVSSTINLPSDVTKETVGGIYLKSWEEGLKGVTVYRDGCRSGVLISNKAPSAKEGRPTSIQVTQAPKRPNVMPCDVYHGMVQGELWTIVVGLMEGKPYELFGGPAEEAGIPKSVVSGYLEKIKASKNINKYNLIFNHYNSETVVEDLSSLFENKVYGTLTRMLSLSLRHGAPVQHIVEQLGKDVSEDLYSLSSVLKRALKKYVTDGTKVSKTSALCPECGGNNLKYQEGCPTCSDCGYTKCQ